MNYNSTLPHSPLPSMGIVGQMLWQSNLLITEALSGSRDVKKVGRADVCHGLGGIEDFFWESAGGRARAFCPNPAEKLILQKDPIEDLIVNRWRIES